MLNIFVNYLGILINKIKCTKALIRKIRGSFSCLAMGTYSLKQGRKSIKGRGKETSCTTAQQYIQYRGKLCISSYVHGALLHIVQRVNSYCVECFTGHKFQCIPSVRCSE